MLGIRVQDIRFELHSESFRARVHTYERHPHVLRTDLISGPCQSLPLVVVLKLHDDRELFEKEERFYKTFESERIPQFYGTTTIDSKPALVLSYIEGTPLDDLDDSYLGSLIDLQTKVLDLCAAFEILASFSRITRRATLSSTVKHYSWLTLRRGRRVQPFNRDGQMTRI